LKSQNKLIIQIQEMKRATDIYITPDTVGQSEFFEGRYEPDPRVVSVMQKAEDDYYKEK
jgi:hypothetical protein